MKHHKPSDHLHRVERAHRAVEGLTIAESLGELFFNPTIRAHLLDEEPYLPDGVWQYTDDGEMALAILEILEEHGTILQDELAQNFARRFSVEPYRGYGPGAFRLLHSIANGGLWQLESRALFSGSGSFGNGSAMRIAPLAAYFAEDPFPTIIEQARLSAEVTHRHSDGIAGGIATAVAGAFAWQNRGSPASDELHQRLFDTVIECTPKSEVRDKLEHAAIIAPTLSTITAANLLGNGSRVSCQDTVPFCIWMISSRFDNYERAVWETISVGGDIDTNAAIVGGAVALSTNHVPFPAEWLRHREPLKFQVGNEAPKSQILDAL